MKRLMLLSAISIFLLTASAAAQNPILVAGNKWGIFQDGQTLVEVQAFTYRYYLDGSSTGAVIAFTCTGTATPFSCVSGPTPIFSRGNHTISFTAANQSGESGKSTPFAFEFVTNPNTPTGTRIIP